MRSILTFVLLTVVAAAPALAIVRQDPASHPSRPRSAAAGKKTPSGVVNINTAAAAELQSLPGIGAKTAERIVDYRQKNGPFKKIEELMNVRGVGEKNFLKLKNQITVAAAKTDHAQQ